MREKTRIKRILAKLEELWNEYPDQRLGQLLYNYTRFGTRLSSGGLVDIFHYEDNVIEEDLDAELNRRQSD